MQVLLHSDQHTNGSKAMSEHFVSVANDALGRFGECVTRVEAHLCDVNGTASSNATDIHCTLEAQVIGAESVIVKDQAGNAHQAIEGALRKLKRAIGAAVAKQDPRRPSKQAVAVVAAALDDVAD